MAVGEERRNSGFWSLIIVRAFSMSTPKPRIDKYDSRKIRVQIRHVLLEVWDPIGVKDEPNAQDEYDGYLGDVYELLVNGAPDAKIAKYLHWVVFDRMGLESARISDMAPTVQALKAIPIPSDGGAASETGAAR